MKKLTNYDIWNLQEYFKKSHNKTYVVIPSNIGWKRNGENVMGAGVAKQCKIMYPEVPLKLGEHYKYLYHSNPNRDAVNNISINWKRELIFFPTKALNKERPWLSWQHNSDLETIKQPCFYLKELIIEYSFAKNEIILLPLVGCGNGGLDKELVIPILEHYFNDLDNIVLVINE